MCWATSCFRTSETQEGTWQGAQVPWEGAQRSVLRPAAQVPATAGGCLSPPTTGQGTPQQELAAGPLAVQEALLPPCPTKVGRGLSSSLPLIPPELQPRGSSTPRHRGSGQGQQGPADTSLGGSLSYPGTQRPSSASSAPDSHPWLFPSPSRCPLWAPQRDSCLPGCRPPSRPGLKPPASTSTPTHQSETVLPPEAGQASSVAPHQVLVPGLRRVPMAQ